MTMDDLNSTPSRASNGSPEQQHIRLACQACQRKKIKCDRHFPCGQCTRSNLQCTQSTRKPRARHIGKRAIDSELRNRISKLENLVESLSGEVANREDTSDSDEEALTKPSETSPAVDKYLGSPFWSSLTTEVQALREALEEEQPEDEAEPTPPSTAPTTGSASEYDFIICPPNSVYILPGALTEPSPEVSAALCDAFCGNVDRMFKIFHTPTLRAFMIEGKDYLGHDHTAPCNKAVKAAVWFSATNTLSDEQRYALFGPSYPEQLQKFRRLVHVAFAQADLMSTTELATLQAFTSYLAAARMTDTSRRVWTLTSVAVRTARALGLHHESVRRPAFQTELRRRLWHQIRWLDAFSGLDRGSELLINNESFDTPLPANTNDDEFDETSTNIPDHKTGLTDMSFARMAYDATWHTHRLTIPESKPNGDTWQQRLEIAQQFQQTLQDSYARYCDKSDPFQRFISQVSDTMTRSMLLRAVRPMQKHVSSVPPRVDSPYVLDLALKSLQASEAIQCDPDTKQWRWLNWIHWHALSIALAGLCSIRDTDLANQAWPVAERACARHMENIADARSGMLWKPIQKLYKKANAFQNHDRTPSSVSISPPMQPQLPPLAAAYSTSEQYAPFTTHPSQQTVPGYMPTGGVMNSPMDFNLDNDMMNGLDLSAGDMNWMDFERILEDMSNPGAITLGDMQWPQQVPSEQEWPCPLHQDLM